MDEMMETMQMVMAVTGKYLIHYQIIILITPNINLHNIDIAKQKKTMDEQYKIQERAFDQHHEGMELKQQLKIEMMVTMMTEMAVVLFAQLRLIISVMLPQTLHTDIHSVVMESETLAKNEMMQTTQIMMDAQ